MSTNSIPSPTPRVKRLRVFAGPNGSGKTSVAQQLAETFRLGASVNADALRQALEAGAGVALPAIHASLSGDDFKAFYDLHPLREQYGAASPFVVLHDGRLALADTCDRSARLSYALAILADYLLARLLAAGEDIAFEAVFPFPSEVELMRQAKAEGYQVYLYYVCVASPEVSKQRVGFRVTQGGRGVPDALVAEDYARSLAALKEAVALSDQACLFDNTYTGASLKLEIRRGSEVTAHEPLLPDWITRSLPALVQK